MHGLGKEQINKNKNELMQKEMVPHSTGQNTVSFFFNSKELFSY